MSQPPAKRHKPAPRRSARLQPRAAQPSPSDASASASAAAGGATAAIAAAMPPSVATVAALDAQLALWDVRGQPLSADELLRHSRGAVQPHAYNPEEGACYLHKGLQLLH